jgi:penicillin-binding protein 1C
MPEEKSPPQEDPRDRFRRLLDEAEKTEDEIASLPDEDDSQPQPSQDDYPSTYLDLVGHEPDEPETTRAILVEDDTPVEGEPDEATQPHDEAPTTPPPPQLGATPQGSPPALDTRGMPLPWRVDEIDVEATQVSDIALESVAPQRLATPPPVAPPLQPKQPRRGKRQLNIGNLELGLSCLLRMSLLGAFIIVLLVLAAGTVGAFAYWQIANDLPDPGDLRNRISQFETTRILDREGNVLYEILDPSAGRRTYVTLDDMSPYLVAATLATEDKEFYNHPGFDLIAIIRAFWQNLNSKETVSGASTITQQLTRTLFMSAEERAQSTYTRKMREAILAAEITRRYTKDEILEIYLNENFYGNLAYGVEAAAQTYFGVSAKDLDLGQSAFLAGLPQLPSIYDVFTNRDATLERQQTVLLLMFQTSQEQGCIRVSNFPQPLCIEAGEAANAARQIEEYEFKALQIEMRYPHWVNYVRSILEEQYDPQTIYRSGFTVYTTLDPGLQDIAQKVVEDQVNSLAGKHVTNGALVTIRPSTGEILTLVGSADFHDEEIDGQVNMAVSPRQPGSSIKPINYVAAFEKGWTPATLIWDVRSEFPPSGNPADTRPPYIPVNYDSRYHGPVRVRSALANSYNIPAVKTLDFVGIYDDPVTGEIDGMIAMAERMGITTFSRDDYGLSLTLGGGDVSLLELSAAYAVFANGGRRIAPVAITRIDDHEGNLVFQYETPAGEQVLRPEHAFLIASILSDNAARTPAFGSNSLLNLPFQVAAKTGTTNDFRDNWTLGFTPDVVVGTWVGNADYTPMQGTSGLTGAAPIWNSFMQTAVQNLTGGNPTQFSPPAGIVEKVICTVSGTEPSQWCPSQRSEYFAADQLPLSKGHDLWQRANIDTWTGLLASAECSSFTDNKLGLNVSDPWAVRWVRDTDQGRSWARDMGFDEPVFFTPQHTCSQSDSRPLLAISSPSEGVLITSSPLKVFAQAGATSNFDYYRLEWGRGDDPVDWDNLRADEDQISNPDQIYEWDISDMEAGRVSLRLRVYSLVGTYAETKISFDIRVPTKTPTPTNLPTATPTATFTLTPTSTPTPSFTPTATDIPTDTPPPSDTPLPSATPLPTDTLVPTETDTLVPVATATETETPTP